MTGELVPTGIITRCCNSHDAGPAGSCCDPDDCGPCCPECPTCPRVQAWTPEHRLAVAREHRAWMAGFLARLRRTYLTPRGDAAAACAAGSATAAANDTRTAKNLCNRCTVRGRCFVTSLRNDEPWGVWGGVDEKQRTKLRTARKAIMSKLDPEILAILPVAEQLVDAVHDFDQHAVREAFIAAGPDLRSLCLALAAAVNPDEDLVERLGWSTNRDEHQRLLDAGVRPGAAAVLAAGQAVEAA